MLMNEISKALNVRSSLSTYVQYMYVVNACEHLAGDTAAIGYGVPIDNYRVNVEPTADID